MHPGKKGVPLHPWLASRQAGEGLVYVASQSCASGMLYDVTNCINIAHVHAHNYTVQKQFLPKRMTAYLRSVR